MTDNAWDAFYGPNAGYAIELYERYQEDPDAVDATTRAIFDRLGPLPLSVTAPNGNGTMTRTGTVAPESGTPIKNDDVLRIVKAARLARSIREYGHLAAQIDPLGKPGPGDPMLEPSTHGITDADLAAMPPSIVWPGAGPEIGSCLDAIRQLREIYSGPIGYEFDHVQDYDERAWLHQIVESGTLRAHLSPERRRGLLQRLTEVEGFERYLHTVFVGQKRFSIEGNDTLVPMLDLLIDRAAGDGIGEVLIGMAHRGRLNVLVHILGKPYAAIFSQFHSAGGHDENAADGTQGMSQGWTGDVKYHLGAAREVREETNTVRVTLADNPSHLEVVNPVVEGFARAAQDNRSGPGVPVQDINRALPITIHGDAAFPGEGVVAETLNLSRLPGYETGGTIRIISNNQIGFTTGASAGRSTLYASDLAKGFEIPIVHVNADDPEACLTVIRLAHAYRERFHKDFLVDLVGYRRWGHNEGDEPSFTQPGLYATIAAHPTVRELYAAQLEREGIVSSEEVQRMAEETQARLKAAREESPNGYLEHEEVPWQKAPPLDGIDTRVPIGRLREIAEAVLSPTGEITVNSKLARQFERRRETFEREGGIDWGLAETLAFGSILAQGTPIRLTGQDTERGTFSQRHLVLHDVGSEREYTPLQHLPQARASFAVYNSPLTEAAVIGFEYGYSVHGPDALVLWEAQFGDFANTGQVLIDQFLTAARAKWRQQPSLVMLLPHGYEGQGPEHSSARLERYLQLAAEDNIRIANCTNAAQYFHLLRVQAATLKNNRRPLIVMTPKSLLRHPRAATDLRALAEGAFHPVLDDAGAVDRRDRVQRLVLCSGKVAVDLTTTSKTRPGSVDWLAVARLELLYPFPEEQVRSVLEGYPNLREVVWLQEEPQNMGAWTYVAPHLQAVLLSGVELHYIGRPARASTAEGSIDVHSKEQARIVEAAFDGERPVKIETHGVHDVS